MPRWPWQTREDIVIRLLDEALRDAAATREKAQQQVTKVKREVEKHRRGSREGRTPPR